MTQKMAIAYVIENCTLPEDVAEKLAAMKASLEKKSAKTGERKPTATQVANEGFKAVIVEAMQAEPTRLFTITEMVKEFPFGEELSGQRVSAIVKQLKDAGIVERIEDKRKAYFRIAQ